MITMIRGKLKKWGNSFGVIVPKEIVESENLKENQKIDLIIPRDSRKVFDETFGMLKGKIKKPTQQIMDETRKELYHND